MDTTIRTRLRGRTKRRAEGLRALCAGAVMAAAMCGSALAQESALAFGRLSIEQGLSQSIVECMIQDDRGFMWFGTQDGLNKYDGYQFTVLRQDPADPNSLSQNYITALCEDRVGKIWVGVFNGGVNLYDPSTERFRRFRANRNVPGSLSDDLVRAVCEDAGGTIWVGTNNGLNRYDRSADRFVSYFADPGDPSSLSHNNVRRLFGDRSGFLWVGTDAGLNRLDPRTGTFEQFHPRPGDPWSLSSDSIRALLVDRKGVLWVGTEDGLNRFDASTGKFTRYRNVPGDPHSLSSNAVYSILEDSEGTLWIGTNGGGLNALDRETGKFVSYRNDPFKPLSLSYNEIWALCEDRSGVLWIGTWGGGLDKVATKWKRFLHYKHDPNNPNSLSHDIVWSLYEDGSGILWIGTHGGGLNRLDRRTNQFTHYRHDPSNPRSLSNDFVRVIFADRGGTLWIGTNGGGLDRFDPKEGAFTAYRNDPDDPNSLSHDEIRCITGDRDGRLWIGTNGGGLDAFDPRTGKFLRYRHDAGNPRSLSNDYVRTVYEDRGGVLWVGTQGGGLNRLDRSTGEFTAFRENASDSTSISSDFVMYVFESRAGVLWVATWGGGLDRFDPATRSFTSYTVEDGLASNAIYGCLEDSEGKLWMSTNNGLSRFDPKTSVFKNYNVEDGLQSKEFDALAFFESPSGEMFFGGINGFNAFRPENIRDNPYVPPIVITSFAKVNKAVKLGGASMSEATGLKLSYRDYVFSFEFAALDYTAPGRNRYAYKMEGLDRDWIYTDASKRYANYTTLPPGKYVFRVKGSNSDGVWNEEGVAVRITTTPPFWGTWWFRALVLLAVATLTALWFRRRVDTVRLATELRAAHAAQMSIMPSADPKVPGFEISGVCIPASEVGGDFFDYFWLDEAHAMFGIAVGDVSGKAMDAAMIAVMSNGMIASRADETFSPGRTMTRLNRPLYEKTREHTFTALWLGALDVARRSVTFSNAGIVDPLLVSGGSVSPVPSAGTRLPLGSVKDTEYREARAELAPGSVLVLFTDGVTDAQNGAQESYEYESLRSLLAGMNAAALPAEAIKNLIISDVKRFMGAAPQYDDITVVVVKAV